LWRARPAARERAWSTPAPKDAFGKGHALIRYGASAEIVQQRAAATILSGLMA
jgi:hypothetical protein